MSGGASIGGLRPRQPTPEEPVPPCDSDQEELFAAAADREEERAASPPPAPMAPPKGGALAPREPDPVEPESTTPREVQVAQLAVPECLPAPREVSIMSGPELTGGLLTPRCSNDLEVAALSRLRALSAQARAEVRDAAERLLSFGLGSLPPDRLLAELNAAATGSSAVSLGPGANVWRNVRYGEPDCRRLDVFEQPGVAQTSPLGSLPFGERLIVSEEAELGAQQWARLADGPFAEKWVQLRAEQADGPPQVNCVRMSDWAGHLGAIPPSVFRPQGYPEANMATRGYAGSSDVCLISASAASLWRYLHVETLYRDIATATVREEHWAGEKHFSERIVHFATNCAQYGQLRTRRPKRLVVVVRPSMRWRSYQRGACMGPKVSLVKDDLDEMQLKECTWLHSGAPGLELKWSSVEFLTALEFFKAHCHWTEADCQRAANEKLITLLENYHLYSTEECKSELEAAYWCWDEAFASAQVQQPGARESCCQLLREVAEMQEHRPDINLGSLKAAADEVQDKAAWASGLGSRAWQLLLKPLRAAAESVGQQVYVMGGCANATADRLHATKHSWAPTASMPSRKSHLAAAVLRGRLFTMGGRDGDGHFLTAVDCFEAEKQRWVPFVPLPTARASLAAAVLNGRLYAVGGWNGKCQLGALDCIEPPSEPSAPSSAPSSWRALPTLATARAGLAAAACHNGGIYALGGEGSGCQALATVEHFSLGRNAWSTLKSLPTARSGLSACVLGGGLFAVGGFAGADALAVAERMDMATGVWTSLAPMPTPRHGLAAPAAAGVLYAIGGRDAKYSAVSAVECYDPVEASWRSVTAMPASRGYLAAGVLFSCSTPPNACNSCYQQ